MIVGSGLFGAVVAEQLGKKVDRFSSWNGVIMSVAIAIRMIRRDKHQPSLRDCLEATSIIEQHLCYP